ncbi:MAG: hypothetical protein M1812_006279 [Candelaria pacifica]|nr:MAG: hypothetical protein M1812_006279 [Candelaria pacifica]
MCTEETAWGPESGDPGILAGIIDLRLVVDQGNAPSKGITTKDVEDAIVIIKNSNHTSVAPRSSKGRHGVMTPHSNERNTVRYTDQDVESIPSTDDDLLHPPESGSSMDNDNATVPHSPSSQPESNANHHPTGSAQSSAQRSPASRTRGLKHQWHIEKRKVPDGARSHSVNGIESDPPIVETDNSYSIGQADQLQLRLRRYKDTSITRKGNLPPPTCKGLCQSRSIFTKSPRIARPTVHICRDDFPQEWEALNDVVLLTDTFSALDVFVTCDTLFNGCVNEIEAFTKPLNEWF